MPILPIIDLLILLGWSCLAIGGALKAIAITTRYRPDFFTLGPIELLWISCVFLLFALTLAARTWVKANEPRILSERSTRTSLKLAKQMNESFSRSGPEIAQEDEAESRLPETLAR